MFSRKTTILILSLIVLLTLISYTVFSLITEDNQDEVAVLRSTATFTPTITPTTKPTATPTPPVLFIDPSVPVDILDVSALNDIHISHNPDSPLWFGPASIAPDGEIIHSSTIVFGLAAPFPTIRDNISLSSLINLWLGVEGLAQVSTLYVIEDFARVLSLDWGEPDPAFTEVVEQIPETDTLWEENAWAIVPFEALDPRLKVIYVDEVSPLLKTYDSANDPLALHYHLIQTNSDALGDTDADIQTLVNAIQPGNRAEDKMTTLIMTGVTALVRGTAYRMEQHGVLYPGEAVHHWLSEADLLHISNEVSFFEDCPFPDPAQESLFFCSDPRYIELLDFIGADIIELTGNHNNDMLYARGIDVVPFTLDLYDQYGMAYFGGGRDLAESKSPLHISHNGNNFAFIGCNAHGPDFAWATEDRGGSAPCEDFNWMAEEISRLKGEGYLPIATFQYYEDYYDFVKEHHIRDFGMMAEAGAVIVNGSQAHRPKAMAFSHDAFIDYGLGNLFFDQKWTIDMYGNIIVQTSWVIIQRHTFYDGRHLNVELLTALLEDFAQPRPMKITEREIFLEELFAASRWISR